MALPFLHLPDKPNNQLQTKKLLQESRRRHSWSVQYRKKAIQLMIQTMPKYSNKKTAIRFCMLVQHPIPSDDTIITNSVMKMQMLCVFIENILWTHKLF
jgi:hypothetical protein